MYRASISLARRSPRYARANFSTTPAAALDLSNLYSKLTGWRRKQPASPAVVDPTKSSESERSDDSMQVDSKPRKLKVLGKPKSLEEDWPEVRQFAEFSPWPTNHHRRDLTTQQIDSAISSLQNTDFSSIQARFEAVKKVSAELNIAISDSVLTTLNSVEDLKTHLVQSARPFDEKQPDAIYLNQEDFIGTNITISDPVAERKAEKRRMHELFKKAKDAQKRSADELMQSAN